MKIYLISRTGAVNYDQYDSFVVYANDESEATIVHPLDGADDKYGSWVKSISQLRVEYIGEAKEGAKVGVVSSSFNAG